MIRKIKKWGNSLALRIPKPFAEEVLLKEGSRVDITLENGKIIMTPVSKEYDLERLLSHVNETNIHEEYSYGKPVGNELW